MVRAFLLKGVLVIEDEGINEAVDDREGVALADALGVGGGFFNKTTSLLDSALLKIRTSLIDPLYNSRLLSDLPFQPRRNEDEVVEDEMKNVEVEDEDTDDPSM